MSEIGERHDVRYERWFWKRFVCKLDGVPHTQIDAIARADVIRARSNLPPIARPVERSA